jgi:hypothetical protein
MFTPPEIPFGVKLHENLFGHGEYQNKPAAVLNVLEGCGTCTQLT